MALQFTENRQRNIGLSVTANPRTVLNSVGLLEATQAEAIAEAIQNRYISPLRLGQVLAALGIGGVGTTTDNAIARYDGTGGTLQNSTAILGDDGSLTLTALSANSVGTLGVLGSSFTQADSSAWAVAFSRVGTNFTTAGSGSEGSANQSGLCVQANVTGATSSAANYEKTALCGFISTADPSSGGITRDVTGVKGTALIATTNATGRAFAGSFHAEISSGGSGDGILIGTEVGVYNNGTAQSSLDTTTSKSGLQVVAGGTASSTVAIRALQASGSSAKWYRVLYADPAHIEATGTFLELAGVFSVDEQGNIVAAGITASSDIITSAGRVIVNTATGLAVGGNNNSYQQHGTTAATGGMALGMFNATAGTASSFSFYRSKNASIGSATVVASGDALGAVNWYGAQETGTFATQTMAAQIRAEVDGTVTSGGAGDMPGSIVFATTADGGSSVTDRMKLDSSGRLSIGTNLGTAKLTLSDNSSAGATSSAGTIVHLIGANSTSPILLMETYATAMSITSRRANNTLASPTATAANDVILGINGGGYETTGNAFTGTRAQIRYLAAEAFTNTAQGTYIQLLTTPTGSTTIAERMRIYASGCVAIGTPSDLGAGGLNVVNALATIASFSSTAAGGNVFNFGSTPSAGAVNDSIGVNCTMVFTNGTQYQAGTFRCLQTNATSGSEVTIWSFFPRRAGTLNESLRIDYPSTATQTGLLIYDVDNNALERVTVGAADSGGAGFKVLRIAN